MVFSSPIDVDGNLDLSGYPPPPVLWFTAVIDTLCIPLRCADWRDSLGVDDRSWLGAKVPPLLEHMPSYPSFHDYLHAQDLSWSSFFSSMRNPAQHGQQHGREGIDDRLMGASSSRSSPSIWEHMYKYAIETPSTALCDLSTPTAIFVVFCLVLMLRTLKSFLLPMFSSFGRWTGRHTHGVEWEVANEERISKFGEYVFRLLYHSSIAVFGVYYFWDKEWWAQNGTLALYDGFPNQPVQPGMAWYYLLQAAYNVDAMLSLLILSFVVKIQSPIQQNNKTDLVSFRFPLRIEWSPMVRGDFQEMMIHHVITNLLVVGSSLCRLTRIGSMVFLVHDVSDVPVDLSKLANFLKWKWTTLACFLSMVGVWMITRLYILPFTIYRSILTESHYVVQDGLPVLLYVHYRFFFYILVFLLIILHLAWFVMFLQMFGTFLRKSECHDLSEHKHGEKQDAGNPDKAPASYAAKDVHQPPRASTSKKRLTDDFSEEKKDN